MLQSIQGMRFRTLIRVLARNGFHVDYRCLGRLGFLLACSVINSVLTRCEEADNGWKINNTSIKSPPLFIIGHFRSGTTHLHNLLTLDERFHCPTLYQTMFPHHFAYSQRRGSIVMDFFSPGKRPMDDMPLRSNVPHEDEFALAALSTISPYMRFLFPVTGDNGHSIVDLDDLPPEALEKWKESFVYFVRKLSFTNERRKVLKSPLHLGRVKVLNELFPGSQFIHIVRNPYEVYLSTKKLWEKGISHSHLQIPAQEVVDEIILSWYTELFSLFERDRNLLPNYSLYEVKYEELIRNPRATLLSIYENLQLGGFKRFWEKASLYLESIQGYRKTVYSLDAETREKIRTRWGGTFQRYNYST
ncbi:MAG: sulfotransferase [Patescibacteria group bacterium]|nr:sulfotransferase [Patescibacteria group bacterium]